MSYLRKFLNPDTGILSFLFIQFLVVISISGIYPMLIQLYFNSIEYENTSRLAIFQDWSFFSTIITVAIISTNRFSSLQLIRAGVSSMLLGSLLILFIGFMADAAKNDLIPLTYLTLWGGFALFLVGSAPYLMQKTDEKSRPLIFSLTYSFSMSASFIGASLLGILIQALTRIPGFTDNQVMQYRYSFLLPCILLLAAWTLTKSMKSESSLNLQPKKLFTERMPMRIIAFITLCYFLLGCEFQIANYFYWSYLNRDFGFTIESITFFDTTKLVISIIAALLLPLVIRYKGIKWAFIIGCGGIISGMQVLAVGSDWRVVCGGLLLSAIGASFLLPTLAFYQLEQVKPIWQGRVTGFSEATLLLSSFIATFIGMKADSFRDMYSTGAIFAIAGSLVLLTLGYTWQKRTPELVTES